MLYLTDSIVSMVYSIFCSLQCQPKGVILGPSLTQSTFPPTLLPWFHLGNFIRGGRSVIIMKGGHDEMKSRCGFYSKLEYCEGVVEELGGKLES